MNKHLRIGLAANDGGAHTQELLEAFVVAKAWLGVEASYVWENDERDPKAAVQAARRLADSGVPIVVGHLSAAAAVAAVPVYAARNMAFIAPATSHPHLNPRGWPGVLRAFGTDGRTARSMVTIAPPGEHPAICFERQAYSQALAAELRQRLEAAGHAPAVVEIADDTGLAALPSTVSTLYIAGIHEFCADVARGVRKQGLDCTISVGDDCYTPSFVERAVEAAEGCRISTQILSALLSENGDAPVQGYLPTSVIALTVALQAIALFPELNGAELGKAMRARSWNTPYGSVTFDEDGNLRGLSAISFIVDKGAIRHFRGAPA
ncbi:ABC transporter substrate-binding protein [Labrys okinawensis]|uniref:ABC transporter substrate-binding protein n=1 Tax=Labrys okinawensis TaxID=346911 RepID=UPI0015E3B8B6|nr:ABC transporter substrate-binding protein [Labrys okinawensis]